MEEDKQLDGRHKVEEAMSKTFRLLSDGRLTHAGSSSAYAQLSKV